jgi:hypothetical protein
MDAETSLAEWHVGPDWQIEVSDAHCLALGRVVARLHILEVMIRLALHEAHDMSVGGKPSIGLAAFHLLKKGDSVGVDENQSFEDFDPLKKLVERFNKQFPDRELDLHSVEVRDALAHGRVLPVTVDHDTLFKVVKFARPVPSTAMAATEHGLSRSTASVEFAEVLTADWFLAVERFLDDQIENVRRAALALRSDAGAVVLTT